MKVLEFILGMVVGTLLAHLFLYGFLSEDELQKQVSQKAYCQTIEEMFSLAQNPEERLEFLKKHEKSLAKCREAEK
ncbi:MAG: hypothetical protein ACK42C_08325 [Aquificaceae bacterium]